MWEVDAMILALSAPEWFVLPVAWGESHGGNVNHWIFIKQCYQIVFESIVPPNDVNKMFQDAESEEYSTLPYITAHPWSQWSCHGESSKRERTVPKTSMMTTGISCQSHHCHPRHKDRNGQTEMLCYLFANSIACDVVIYVLNWESREKDKNTQTTDNSQ